MSDIKARGWGERREEVIGWREKEKEKRINRREEERRKNREKRSRRSGVE
jgi:hypothetical protein